MKYKSKELLPGSLTKPFAPREILYHDMYLKTYITFTNALGHACETEPLKFKLHCLLHGSSRHFVQLSKSLNSLHTWCTSLPSITPIWEGSQPHWALGLLHSPVKTPFLNTALHFPHLERSRTSFLFTCILSILQVPIPLLKPSLLAWVTNLTTGTIAILFGR